ncbi:MAG: hypothetical protein KQH53_10880 [Desulfarculaceae bacterium]|nr:hypothetical protein [Desulfarculaceae bacterium]
MAESKKMTIPVVSYKTLTQILRGYQLLGPRGGSLEDIVKKTDISRNILSKSHGFLANLGLISGGRVKCITELGSSLSSAIVNNLDEDVAEGWRTALLESEDAQAVLDMIRVRGEISEDELKRRIFSILEKSSNPERNTGVICLIEILKMSGLLAQVGDQLVWNENNTRVREQEESVTGNQSQEEKQKSDPGGGEQSLGGVIGRSNGGMPHIHIDIQIHISPETTSEQINQIFASMAKHLYKQ